MENIQIEQYDDIYTVRSFGSYAVLTSIHTVGSVDISVESDALNDAAMYLNKQMIIVIGHVEGKFNDVNYLIVKKS